jgi:hypothetical protein
LSYVRTNCIHTYVRMYVLRNIIDKHVDMYVRLN